VPAQSLILLNDPFVHEQANLWAKRVLKDPGTVEERLKGMYLSAFAHVPNDDELTACKEFLKGHDTDVKKWAELAHMLFNVKEFLYVR